MKKSSRVSDLETPVSVLESWPGRLVGSCVLITVVLSSSTTNAHQAKGEVRWPVRATLYSDS